MNTLINSIQTALNINTSIDIEVATQLDEARQLIGTRQAAQAMTNKTLHLVPRLVKEHAVSVSFTNSREQVEVVTKDLNDIMWLITLQSTYETGFVAKAGLVKLFQNWAKENTTGGVWEYKAVEPIAKRFVKELVNLHVVCNDLTVITHKEQVMRVRKLTPNNNQEVLDTVEELRLNASMKCKPLVNVPTDWTNATTGVGATANMSLITGNKVEQPVQVLNAVNKLQRVGFIIAPAMLVAARDMLDNVNEYGVDKELERVLIEIQLYANDTVHFPVTMDKRGRMYYRGGLLSPQGTDFCKAAFQFAESKPLGDTGFDAIAIHTANVCGMDKVSINDRVSWVMANIDSGTFASITDFEDVIQTFPNADIMQATVAILEINRILALDIDPALVSSNLVCHQDGTCNGLQHMAAITGNRDTAESVNCTASTTNDAPKDIYGIISTEAATFATGPILALINKYGRDLTKNPVMISGYGAGAETITANIAKFLAKKGENAVEAPAVSDAILAALESKAAAVGTFVKAIKSRMNNAVANGLTEATWTTADGFKCVIAYTDIEDKRVRAGGFNAIKQTGATVLDEIKTIGAMAPNLIHSIDAAHLRLVINKCDFELVTVHDSIGSHASDFMATAQAIREQFVVVHAYDALANVCESMNVPTPKFVAKRRPNGYNAFEALNSTYIFS